MATSRNAHPKRRLSLRGLIVIIFLVTLLVLCFAMGWFRLGGTKNELKALDGLSASAPHTFTGSGFVFMRGNTLVCQDVKLKPVWEVNMQSSDVRLAASPTVAAVYNSVALTAVSTQTGATQMELSFTGTVEDVRCSESYVAVLKKDTRNVSSLLVYDTQGNRLDNLTMGEYTVMDFGFYGKNQKFYTLALNTSGKLPVSTITTFNTGQSNTGIMPIEGQIVDKLFFDEENAIYAAGTNYLMAFNGVGKETARRLIYGWKVLDFEMNAAKPSFLLVPRRRSEDAADPAVAKIMSLPEGSADAFVNLPAGTLSAYLCGGKVVAVTDGELFYYSLKGDLTKRVALKAKIEKVQKLDASRLLMMQGDSAYIVAVN